MLHGSEIFLITARKETDFKFIIRNGTRHLVSKVYFWTLELMSREFIGSTSLEVHDDRHDVWKIQVWFFNAVHTMTDPVK